MNIPGKWRVGSKVKLNVYEADRPVCQCHSFLDAYAIVAAMNRFAAQAPVFDFDDRQPEGGPPAAGLADSQPSNYNPAILQAWHQSLERHYRKIEREACLSDIKAAFWGDERISNRYDIARFILDRIRRREEDPSSDQGKE